MTSDDYAQGGNTAWLKHCREQPCSDWQRYEAPAAWYRAVLSHCAASREAWFAAESRRLMDSHGGVVAHPIVHAAAIGLSTQGLSHLRRCRSPREIHHPLVRIYPCASFFVASTREMRKWQMLSQLSEPAVRRAPCGVYKPLRMPATARQYTNHEPYAFEPNDDEADGGQICQRSKLHRSRLCHLHGAAQHGEVRRESSSPHLRPRRAHSQSLPREVARHKAAVSHLSRFCSSSGGVRA